MIIKIKYDKSEKTLVVSNDIPECTLVVNENTIIDNNDELSFELALDTSYLAEIQSTNGELNE